MSHLSWLQNGPYARFQKRISGIPSEDDVPYGHARSHGRRADNPLKGGMAPRRVRFRFRAKAGLAIEMLHDHHLERAGKEEAARQQREFTRNRSNSNSNNRPRRSQSAAAATSSYSSSYSYPATAANERQSSSSSLCMQSTGVQVSSRPVSASESSRTATMRHDARADQPLQQLRDSRPHSNAPYEDSAFDSTSPPAGRLVPVALAPVTATEQIRAHARAVFRGDKFSLEQTARLDSHSALVALEEAPRSDNVAQEPGHRNRFDLLLDEPRGNLQVEQLLQLCSCADPSRVRRFSLEARALEIAAFEAAQENLAKHQRRPMPKHAASMLDTPCSTGFPPLCIAAARNDFRAVDILLQAGAVPNARDVNGFSAMHWAAARGFCQCLRVLIDAGASTKLMDRPIRPFHRMMAGITPIDAAKRFRQTAAVELMLSTRRAAADQIVKQRIVPSHVSSELTKYERIVLKDAAGGDGASATLAVERGRGFLFPISRDFDRSGGIDSERQLLTRAGSRLAPLGEPVHAADVPAMSGDDTKTPAAAPNINQESEWLTVAQRQLPGNTTELQKRRLLVEEAEKRATQARAMVAIARKDIATSLNPSAVTSDSGLNPTAAAGCSRIPGQAAVNTLCSGGSVSGQVGKTKIDKIATLPTSGLSRDEQHQQLQAVDRLRGVKAFRIAVRVAVVRWKNAVSKRKLRDKLAKAALGRELAVKNQAVNKQHDIELRRQWTQAKTRAAKKKAEELVVEQERLIELAGEALLLPSFCVPQRRRLHTKQAQKAKRRRRAGGAVLKVWARKGAGNVPDVDLQEAATFISPLQRCLEDIDERFGEQAAKASEHMLLQVRSDRLQAQAEADLVFVAATTIQNVYRQRDARRRLKFVRTVRAALRAKEEADKEERARAKAEELQKAAALRDEVEALKELEYLLQKNTVSVQQLEIKLRVLERAELGTFAATRHWDGAVNFSEWALSVGVSQSITAGIARMLDSGNKTLEDFLEPNSAAELCEVFGLEFPDGKLLWQARQQRVRAKQLASLRQRLAGQRKELALRRRAAEAGRKRFFEGKRNRQRDALQQSQTKYELDEKAARTARLAAFVANVRSAALDLDEETASAEALFPTTERSQATASTRGEHPAAMSDVPSQSVAQQLFALDAAATKYERLYEALNDAAQNSTSCSLAPLAAILTPFYLNHLTRDGTLVDGGVGLCGADARDDEKVQAAMREMMIAAWRIQRFVRSHWEHQFFSTWGPEAASQWTAARVARLGQQSVSRSDEIPTDPQAKAKPTKSPVFSLFWSVTEAHGTVARVPKPMILPGLSESAPAVQAARALSHELEVRAAAYRERGNERRYHTARTLQRVFRGHLHRRRFAEERALALHRAADKKKRRQIKTGMFLSPERRFQLQQEVAAADSAARKARREVQRRQGLPVDPDTDDEEESARVAPAPALQPVTSPLIAKQLVKSVPGLSLEHAKATLKAHQNHYAVALAALRDEARDKEAARKRMLDLMADRLRQQSHAALYGKTSGKQAPRDDSAASPE